ncbi:MAG: UDP-N-acetylmuramoyl-tripeptide--D-alanyl-D-alanine ligase [Deltaproteobacteria bacterium]|nr:UDP-N-acetylmuramoyl-tripeptide--D-alanyl-D-alanine ligase [Deltaproteobacteria bacterium]
MRFDGTFLQTATGGAWDRGLAAATDDISIDSRTLPQGALYVALIGEVHDGHKFCASAKEHGAVAAMIARAKLADVRATGFDLPLLVVDDTLKALQALANAHRRRLNARMIGVCGSNGKTTTKEMIASVVAQAGRTHRTTGNLNNHIGLPLSLLRMDSSQAFGVLETGMNHPGELRELGVILEPEIAVMTTIQAEHLEGLGTIENVAKAEGELLERVRPKGVAILPADEPLAKSHALPKDRSDLALRWFGESASADVRLVSWSLSDDGGTRVEYATKNGTLKARLPHLGKHNAVNAAAAVCVGVELGLTNDQIVRGLESTPLVDRRMRIHKTGALVVLDDCYNANPGSMGAALEVLGAFRTTPGGKERRILAFLGDMLELGDAAPHEHEKLGALAAKTGVHALGAFGPFAKTVIRAAEAGGQKNTFASEDMAALIAFAKSAVQQGDVVLVKGSRGMKMERLIAALGVQAEGGSH